MRSTVIDQAVRIRRLGELAAGGAASACDRTSAAPLTSICGMFSMRAQNPNGPNLRYQTSETSGSAGEERTLSAARSPLSLGAASWSRCLWRRRTSVVLAGPRRILRRGFVGLPLRLLVIPISLGARLLVGVWIIGVCLRLRVGLRRLRPTLTERAA